MEFLATAIVQDEEAPTSQAEGIMTDATTHKRYRYEPSLAAAVIFVVLFCATSGFHLYQMTRTRSWLFIAFCSGGLFELIGYICRAIGATQTEDPDYALGPFIIQSVLLLVAPALLAASIYMELERIVQLVQGDPYILIKSRWLTRTFVTGDIISFLMQAAGGGILGSAKTSSQRDLGTTLVVVGLFVQIVFFGCFIFVALLFHWRIQRTPTQKVLSDRPPYNRHLFALYGVSSLIFVRSLVRVVEFIEGFDGYISTHETFIYVFDAAPMFAAMLIMNWIHPSEIEALLRGGSIAKGIRLIEHYETTDNST